MYDNSSRVIEVDINEILPNRFQPRIQFDEEEILELSDSIKEHGVIQPLVVRTIGDKYEIIAGERRYKASVLAGKETVPVIVKNLNDKDSAEIALIENIQRKNLTPIEEALSYKKILDMGYITQENLASKLGKSQSAVANKIRLLNLSDEVQEALLENKISERHARSLLKLTTSKQQNEMLNRIISERLTVRRADEEIDKIKNNIDEDNDADTQKIIEKGEIEMNNNVFGMPNIPQNSEPTGFDIFGPSNQQPIQSQSVVSTIPESVQPSMTSGFDIFGGTSTPSKEPSVEPEMSGINFGINNTATPEISTSIPEVSTPIVDVPMMPEMPTMAGIDFGMNNNISTTTSEPVSVPDITIPTMEATVMPEIPEISEINFGINNNTMSEMSTQVEAPVTNPTPVVSEIPVTAPIIETPIVSTPLEMTQQTDNLFSFGSNNMNNVEVSTPVVETPTVPEFKMPEPIIVTDYSKQYDPIMPQYGPVAPAVDFKEVINAIRECSNKIEQFGFKIDVEEIDLSNLYQVIFKIEKQ